MLKTLSEVKSQFGSCDKIKRGGQKIVYKAIYPKGEIVAFKVVSSPGDKRVLQEIGLLQTLKISNVPKIYKADYAYDEATEEEVIYIIEEYLDGVSMRDWLESGNKLTLRKAYNLLHTLLSIEIALEEKRVLHRDINPNNIVLMNTGEVYLIDFGLAKCLEGTSLTLTVAQYGVFTPGYAPHEQFNNDKAHQDVRTDLFQIGVTVYEGCMGKNPFTDGEDSILGILSKTIALNPEKVVLPGDSKGMFSQLISMLMAKNQSQRPDSATDAMRYLEGIKQTLVLEG